MIDVKKVSVEEGSLSVRDENSKVVMRWVKNYRNSVHDEECSFTNQGFVRDVFFCSTRVTE